MEKKPLFELNYFGLLDEDVRWNEFYKFNDLIEYIKKNRTTTPKVYLFCKESGNNTNKNLTESIIVITHNFDELNMMIWWNEDFRRTGVYFYQEYKSYEYAYDAALMMREPTGLAYI